MTTRYERTERLREYMAVHPPEPTRPVAVVVLATVIAWSQTGPEVVVLLDPAWEPV